MSDPYTTVFARFHKRKRLYLGIPEPPKVDININDEEIIQQIIYPTFFPGTKVTLKSHSKSTFLVISRIDDTNDYICEKLDVEYGIYRVRYIRTDKKETINSSLLKTIPDRHKIKI